MSSILLLNISQFYHLFPDLHFVRISTLCYIVCLYHNCLLYTCSIFLPLRTVVIFHVWFREPSLCGESGEWDPLRHYSLLHLWPGQGYRRPPATLTELTATISACNVAIETPSVQYLIWLSLYYNDKRPKHIADRDPIEHKMQYTCLRFEL